MALTLRTPRLHIEPLVAADIAGLVAYRRDPDVARWQSWTPDWDDSDARVLIAGQPSGDLPDPGGWVQLAIRDATTGALHGDVAIHVVADQPATYELGITVAPGSQRQGIATEAMLRVLDHLFADAGAHRVIACCDARNRAVARLLVRIGMRRESRQMAADWSKGEWTTLDGYALLANEHGRS